MKIKKGGHDYAKILKKNLGSMETKKKGGGTTKKGQDYANYGILNKINISIKN